MSRKKLYIVGAGELGREVGSWLKLMEKSERDFDIMGYLDNDMQALEGYNSPYQVLGSEVDFEFSENSYVIIAISNVEIKHKIYKYLKGKAGFYKFIHPTAIIGIKVERQSPKKRNTTMATKIKASRNVCSTCSIEASKKLDTS